MGIIPEHPSGEVLPVFTSVTPLAEYLQVLWSVIPAIPYPDSVMDMQMLA